MVLTPRTLALLPALCISLITTLFLSLFESVEANALVVVSIVSFTVSYLLLYLILEFLIFREIGKIYKLLKRLRKKDLEKTDRKDEVTLNPLRTISDEIYSFADVKETEIDELRKLEAFRKEFIANVSHELKTPIFAAQGFVHTLLDGAVNDKAVRNKFLKKAAKSLDGLDRLVQDLLTISQIETGQIKMHFENIDLAALTREVFEQLEEKAEAKGIELKIAPPVQDVKVFADWQRITQVMTNLISNAIKHSDEDGAVEVSFKFTKKYVVTSVIDYGEGISKEHIHRIFERFYTVDKSRSREKGGTGLGLAIVKHILDGHQSKPKVESQPGKGSKFSFKLPRTDFDHSDKTDTDQIEKD